jgi:hypothetical protein
MIALRCCHSARMEDDRAAGPAPAGLRGAALAIHRAEQRARHNPGSIVVDTYDDLPPDTPRRAAGWEAWLRE